MLDKRRAAVAWQKVNEVKTNSGNAEKYDTLAHRLPAMIVSNGLGQSLAFLRADAGGETNHPAYKLYQHIAEWLMTERNIYQGQPNQLMDKLLESSRDQYLMAQQEAVLFTAWIKKFCDALLDT